MNASTVQMFSTDALDLFPQNCQGFPQDGATMIPIQVHIAQIPAQPLLTQSIEPFSAVCSETSEINTVTPSDQIQSIIQQAREAWLTGDAVAFAALFVAEGEFIAPGNRWIGPEQIRQAAADYASAYDVLQINIRQIIQVGDRAVVEWYWQDREKATGNETQADDAIVIDFQAGCIARWREYIDAISPQGSD